MSHLRYAGLAPAEQSRALEAIIRAEQFLMEALKGLRKLDLPDSWIVSGAIYNTVWNQLTGRPSAHGIKDIDVFYFDDRDTSYEAEDLVIQRAAPVFAGLPVPVEIRNQARVHLWYPEHFGVPCEPLLSCEESIRCFASKTHAVGVRLCPDDSLDIVAPYGLDDIFAFRVVPNHVRPHNGRTHEQKALRARSNWPELTVLPW